MNGRKVVSLSLLTALSCAVFGLEALLPPMPGMPGLKLGLANLFTLLAMDWFGRRPAALVLAARILLCALFAGQASYLFYSAAGGLLAFLALCLFYKAPLWARSAFAAIGHNLGQLLVAGWLMGSYSVLWLLLYLTLGAIISGSIIGVAAALLVRRLSFFVKGERSCRN